MSEPVIRVENLSKRYRIGKAIQVTSRKQRALRPFINSFHYLASNLREANEDEILWALKDISFEVQAGEVLGIIGRNGAGKSTLLKILARITEPSSGRAVLNGRVGSLLEVGTGFNQELTGRENIFLSGAILGMKKNEIERKFDEIVAFAEVEKFLDTPVKRYSSGMYVRLAFAVAAHLEPEILLVDEVLAVGDMAFQRKCLDKMGTVTKEGRTIIFVSHNMGAIKGICNTAILLEMGSIAIKGPVDQAVDYYLKGIDTNTSEILFAKSDGSGNEKVRLLSVRAADENEKTRQSFRGDENIVIYFRYQVNCILGKTRFGIRVIGSQGEILFASTDNDRDLDELDENRYPGIYENRCVIPGKLLNSGRYLISITADIPMREILLLTKPVISFEVELFGGVDTNYSDNRPGYFRPLLDWNYRKIDA